MKNTDKERNTPPPLEISIEKYIELMGRPKPRKTTLESESLSEEIVPTFDDLFKEQLDELLGHR